MMGGPQISHVRLGAWSFLLVVLVAGLASAHGPAHERLEHASKQIEADPQNGELYVRRAALYLEHGEFNLAIEDTVRAKALGSDGPGAPLLHARALLGLGRLDEALRVSSGTITNTPSAAFGYVVRAEVLKAMGRPQDASADLAVAIRCSDNPSVDLYLKRSQLLIECDEANAALACLRQGLVDVPRSEVLRIRLCELTIEVGQYGNALPLLDELIARATRKERWLARKADVLSKLGRTDAARAATHEAIEAIESLPSRQRKTPAMVSLEKELRAGMGAPE